MSAAAPAFEHASREGRVARPGTAPRNKPGSITWVWLLALLLLHIPLALLLKRIPMLSTLHAMGCVLLGVVWGLADRPRLVACVGAYMASSELLWRMTGASVFWEFGKYGISFIFLVSLVKSQRLTPRLPALSYFVLLLPAAIPTLLHYEWHDARRDISFNLSGPFALMVAVIFFNKLQLNRRDVGAVFVAFLAPLMGVAGLAGNAVLSSKIMYGHGSNELASGGFGPNQVSSAMGLGILIAFLGLMDRRVARPLKVVYFAVILAFTMQSALTLSRSGLVIAGACVLAASLFLVRNANTRVKLVGAALLLYALFHFVIFPRLDAFTGGAISARFKNTNATGRDTIMWVDMQIWASHPIMGVGVGEAQMEREKYYRLIAAHNEFTRLVAEHGLFGFVAMIFLIQIAVRGFKRARDPQSQALVASMFCFSLLFMVGNGMRLALVSYTFGLAAATFLPPLVKKGNVASDAQPKEAPLVMHPNAVVRGAGRTGDGLVPLS